jgi:colanic acid/amylovoran biosynthesis glycosyltransferase
VRSAAAGVDRVPGRIVFVGRLVEKKGVAVLLDAVRRLAPGGWSLEVIGDGPLRAELAERAAGLPVTFRGSRPRTEVGAAYARGEIVVVPSVSAASGDQDGLPVTLLEAMSAGCAVIGSRIAGIDTAVEDGETGLLVPPGDAGRLADAIAELLAHPERGVKLGAAARARSDEFSVEVVGRRYCALLRQVLERSCPRGVTRAPMTRESTLDR